MDIRFVHPHFRFSNYDTNNTVKNTAIPSLQIPMGKVPRSPAAHKKKRKKRKKPTARYLIDQYGEKGKAYLKKKSNQFSVEKIKCRVK
jgi:hypothetical protein